MGAKQSSNMDNIDISSYLTQEQADEIYQGKPPTDDEFILKTYADDTYKFPEDYVSKNELSAYLLEDKAKRLYQELPPKGDQFVLKSYTDQLNRLTSNYATMTELNKYITQELASSLYQAKEPNGNLIANTIWNKSTDFMLGSNDARGNFSNNMWGGRALVKDANTQLVMNYAGDFGGGVRIDGNNGLLVNGGPISRRGIPFKVGGNENTFYPVAIDTNLSWETSNVFKCNISRSSLHYDENGKGSFSMIIEGHNTLWGNGADFIRYKLVNAPWGKYKNFVANVRQDYSSTWVIVFLRGNSTYYFSGEGCSLAYPNTQGVSPYVLPVGEKATYNALTAPVAPFGPLNVYYDSVDNTAIIDGKMGIGTNNPQDTLDVNGDIFISGQGAYIKYGNYPAASTSGNNFPYMVLNKAGAWGTIGALNRSGNDGIYLGVSDPVGANSNKHLTILDNGRIGIGTIDPVSTLDIGTNGVLCFGAKNRCINANTSGIAWTTIP
jgi:hypothetical protein